MLQAKYAAAGSRSNGTRLSSGVRPSRGHRLRCRLQALFALLLLGIAPAALAQVPQVTQGVPAESFLGEGFCFDTTLSNTGAPGFGPYLRLELPPGLSFTSAEIFESAATVINVGVFPPAPGNTLVDPFTGQPVTGTPGSQLRLIELPIGSVVTGGPPLTVTTCLAIEPSATIGVPLPVGITPVYRYGDTATGANGPIVGAMPAQSVTPTVLLFEKDETAPESERPPGASWPYEYVLTVDIANTATLNPVVISDQLPAEFQYVGPTTVTGGNGCVVSAEPSTATPGGTLTVTCSGNTTGTTAGHDIVVRYSGHIVDILDEGMCATAPVTNQATVNATYQPPVGAPLVLPQAADTEQVTAKHVALQKGASPGTVSPGGIANYTLQGQVTDFGDVATLSIEDTLADGLRFIPGSATLTAPGFGGVAIVPVVSEPGDGTQVLVFDVGAITGTLPAGTAFSLAYQADVLTNYVVDPVPGDPVRASDVLPNVVQATYSLVQGAAGCLEGSAADVEVQPINLAKSILNPQPAYAPGDVVTYVLTMGIPSGDAQQIRFEDYFPLPVFDVTDLNLTFGTDIRLGAGHTLPGFTPAAISINAAQNALFVEWPDLDTNGPQVLQLEVDVTVVDNPFADDLFLTNLLLGFAGNTPGEATSAIAPIPIHVRAPVLVLTKGVLSSSAGTIAPPPATLPVDGNVVAADAGDTITFRVTIENIGGANAHEVLVTDTPPAGLTGCAVVAVTNGSGAPMPFGGNLFGAGLTVAGPLAPNDGNPAGGGPPYGADTLLVDYSCSLDGSVQPLQVITNTASASWASQPGGPRFASVSDDATVTVAGVSLAKSLQGSSEGHTSDAASPPRVAIGEIVRYRLSVRAPEGTLPNFQLVDNLPTGLQFLNDGSARVALVGNGGGISSSTLAGPGLQVPGNSAVAPTFVLPASAISPASFGSGTDVTFSLGTLTNNDRDGDSEFVVVEFNALVLNISGNGTGTNRANTFIARVGGSQVGPTSNSVSVRTVQPAITLAKSVLPLAGDAGDPVTYTIVATAATGADRSTAYEVAILDTLPAQLENVTVASITTSGSGATGAITDSSAGNSIDIAVASMAPGAVVTVTITANLALSVAPGTSVVNTAQSTWTSLPGANGTAGNPTGSTTPGAPGTGTGERTGSGGVNSYSASDAASVSISAVVLSKLVTGTSEGHTGVGQGNPMAADLTIGERVTYQILAAIPEGTTPSVVITDTVPYSNGVMEVIGASVVEIGSKLSTASPGTPVISDTQLADGIADTARFDFGQVINDPLAAGSAQIVVQVDAVLRDLPANANTDVLTNTALVQFGPGLSASAQAQTDTVEPLLAITKDGSIDTGEAGDLVTFTVQVSHQAASRADAQNVIVQDVLPADLIYEAATLAVAGMPATTVDDSGGVITVAFDTLPLGQSATITYQARLAPGVVTAAGITNTAALDWTSLVDDTDPDSRSYAADDSHTIQVSEPGVSKTVFATSEGSTGSGQYGAPQDLTIGEEVTYRMVVSIPEGVTPGAVFVDQLPTVSATLALVDSEVVRIGANLSGPGLPAVGAAGTASDSDGDGFDDRATWNLGDISNPPNGSPDAAKEIEFEVTAVVVDVPVNQGGVVAQANTGTLTSGALSISDSALVDLVEPRLTVTKSVTDPADGFVEAGDVVTHRIVIAHQGSSSADAFNLVLTDTLPSPGLSWVDDATVSSTCGAGFVVDSSAAPLIVFTLDTLPLSTGSCSIEYQATVDVLVNPGQSYVNSVVAEYDSTPVFVAGQTRRGSSNDNASVTVIAPSLVKVSTATSLDDTGSGQFDGTLFDLAIGETVTYEITLVLPEGTTPDAVLVDAMPSNPATGVIEATGASVDFVGGNIGTTLPGTPVFTDASGDGYADTVTFDFGTITNTPDGVSDAGDRIRVLITGRVVDVTPGNVAGAVLSNTGTFTYFGGGLLQDTADIDVVEPQLALGKTMVPQANGVVRIGLSLENTGTGPAYDLEVTDVLSDADWDLGSVAAVSVPAGFELITQPGPGAGELTVVFRSDGGAVPPANALLPGQSRAATFDVALASIPPASNPVTNLAELADASSLPGPDPEERTHPPLQAPAQLGIPQLAVSKSATTAGPVVPGQTFGYALVISNSGQGPATGVVLEDVPDGNVALVAGTVASSQGSVTIGNTPGDTLVSVSLGTIAPGGSATVSFSVTVNEPLPTGVTELVNQALLTSSELPPVSSDDPDEPGPDDPTVVPVEAAPDLSILKDDGGATTAPGGIVAYTLSYANTGNQDATGVVITDVVPANTSFNQAGSTAGWSCADGAPAGSSCSFTVGALAVGSSGSVVFALNVANPMPLGVTSIANTALVADDGSNGPDPTPADNEDSDTTPVDVQAALVLVKSQTGGPNPVTAAGQVIDYSIQLANTGNSVHTGVVLADLLPDGSDGTAQLVGPVESGTANGQLDLGETWSWTISYTVTQADLDAGAALVNTATASTDQAPTPISDDAVTPVSQAPGIAIVKTAGAPSAVAAGGTIAYGFTVTNTGNVTLTGIVVNDAQLDAPAVCVDSTLLPGAFTTCTGVHTLTQAEVNAGESVNSATATGTPPSGPPVTSTPSTTVTPLPATPAISIVKTAGTPSVVAEGGTIAYSFLVTNTGNVTLTGIVVNDAQLDAPAVCALTVLQPGESTTCTGVHTLTQGEVDAGVSLNTATASGTPPSGPPVTSPPSDTSTPLPAGAALALVKTAGAPSGHAAGDTIAYSFLVTNIGNVTLSGIVVNDAQLDAPAVCLATTLAPTVSTTCTGTHTLTQAEVDAGESLNVATATGTPPSGPAVESPPSDTVTPIPAAPSIALVKTAGAPSGHSAGDTIAYTFTVTNTGNVTLTGIVINDLQLDAPAVCEATTLAGGESTTCTGVHTLTQAEVDAGVSDNSATATGTPPVGTPVESPPSDTTTPIPAAPAIAIEKTAGVPTGQEQGATITYTFLVTNTGNVTLTGIVVNDAQLDAPAVCDSTTLVGGESTTCTGVHTITLQEVDDGLVHNSATATGTPPSGPPVTSTPDEVDTPLVASPAIELVKSAVLGDANGNGLGDVGETIAYTLVATNTGNVTLTGVSIVDAMLGTLACTPAQPLTLQPTEAVTCTGSYAIETSDLAADAPLVNTATASGTPPSGPEVEDEDDTSTPLNAVADLVVQKTGPASFMQGGIITWTVLVTNQGPGPADGALFTDPVPGAVTQVVATCGNAQGGAACGTVEVNGNDVSSTVPVLPAGGSLVFTIRGRATGSGALVNVAFAEPPTGIADPVEENNEDEVTTTVSLQPEPAIIPGPQGPALLLLALAALLLGTRSLRRQA